jgi:hypothetical protein
MSALVLDAGAFAAVDRGDRAMVARLRAAERSGIELRSNGVVVAQVWRDPPAVRRNWLACSDLWMSRPSTSRWDGSPGYF